MHYTAVRLAEGGEPKPARVELVQTGSVLYARKLARYCTPKQAVLDSRGSKRLRKQPMSPDAATDASQV
jgi:hypothetical protein